MGRGPWAVGRGVLDVDMGAIKRGSMLLLAASHKQNSPRFVRAVNKLKRIQLAAECLQAGGMGAGTKTGMGMGLLMGLGMEERKPKTNK